MVSFTTFRPFSTTGAVVTAVQPAVLVMTVFCWSDEPTELVGQEICTWLPTRSALSWTGLQLSRRFTPAVGPQGRMTAYCKRAMGILSLQVKRAAAWGP